jgi:fructose-1,6-bisphosphatase/inositol monophosphatase family enzyme
VDRVTAAKTDPGDLLELARKAAFNAGGLVRHRPTRFTDVMAKSSPTDPVTEMDHASEQLIIDTILSARPNDGLVGEEGTSKQSDSGLSWLIDPIDGTVNYMRGLPNYSISIAAEDGKGTLVGAVYDPTLGEMFTASRGNGAALNGESINCAATNLAESVIGTGFSYLAGQRRQQAKVLQGLLPAVADIRRPGSAAVSLCWVACGRLDGFFEAGLQPWDYAAGALIATEAGADIQGLEPALSRGSRLLIASAPSITTGLSQILLGGR